MDYEHIRSDHICLSCGKAMRLARTSPEIGEAPELRIYDCKVCGVVFTESVGAPEWREN
jgi:rubredoxin